MTIIGGGCKTNSDCGPCAICVGGRCEYLCNPLMDICINGVCVPKGSTSGLTHITISGNENPCISTQYIYEVEGQLAGNPYNGLIDIAIVQKSTGKVLINNTDQMTNGLLDYNLTLNTPGLYGFTATVHNSYITDGIGINAINCGPTSTCTTCTSSPVTSTATPFNWTPIVIGGAVGLGGLLLLVGLAKK